MPSQQYVLKIVPSIFSLQGKLGVPGIPGYPGRQGSKVIGYYDQLICSLVPFTEL